MEEVVFNMQENMSKYFQTRARIVAKYKKRPHIQVRTPAV